LSNEKRPARRRKGEGPFSSFRTETHHARGAVNLSYRAQQVGSQQLSQHEWQCERQQRLNMWRRRCSRPGRLQQLLWQQLSQQALAQHVASQHGLAQQVFSQQGLAQQVDSQQG